MSKPQVFYYAEHVYEAKWEAPVPNPIGLFSTPDKAKAACLRNSKLQSLVWEQKSPEALVTREYPDRWGYSYWCIYQMTVDEELDNG